MAPSAKLQHAYEQFRQASERLATLRRPGWGKEASRLDVTREDEGLHVHWLLNEDALFQPQGGTPIFTEIVQLLGTPLVAPWLTALTLEGHQIAANGCIDWEMGPIAYARSRFARLRVFRVESIGNEDGPCFAGSLVGNSRSDQTVATRLLDRMPVLQELSIPEPPQEEAFFLGQPHPLRSLSVSEVDSQSFVSRLTVTRRFAKLEEIQLTESFRSDVCPRLPATQYARLLQSDTFPTLRAVTLRQVDLTDEQIAHLRGTRVGRQLCRLAVKAVKPWCNRSILRASPEPGDSFATLCGPPVQPANLQHKWLTEQVLSLAGGMLDSCDLSAMPVLADALEDAGCDNTEFLAHCRSPGPHLPGCWALDQILSTNRFCPRKTPPHRHQQG
jgi:hypothetical protein